MPKEIYLVKVGMTMKEGTVDEWYVADGQSVDVGEDLYRLETEKVNMDVEAEISGTVRHIAEAGSTLEPGDVIGWIYEPAEEIPDELPAGKPNRTIAVAEESATSSTDSVASQTTSTRRDQKKEKERLFKGATRIAASPAARRLAEDLGIELANVEGTGPKGRITREDVEAAHKSSAVVQSLNTVPLTGLRGTIARRMSESLRETAQLTMSMEVDMERCIDLRTNLNEQWKDENVRVAYTDLILVATARALNDHPLLNSRIDGNQIVLMESMNIGIAVALEDGLIVPVVQDVGSKILKDVAKEAADLALRARNGSLTVDEVSDGTFTVSSLGMYGVDSFTPILNPPQTGILGVGGIYDGIRWIDDKPIKNRKLKLSLTWDHRVVDGSPAAEFLASIRERLEQPEGLYTVD
ncbi:MAG: dihydrolipoamide acetyltransferase family protein [Gammaproteobacteria bacterium]|nr:dihydrolipoamide acetyltransferase family protein [Gammaproteobacteria bacterium]